MANEIRLRRNNIAGTITDNPLTNVATTINSPGFVDLPTVGATQHLVLILDPLELAGPAEIVTVTAHTAASSAVTVVRGAEGSAARVHSVGTTWFHGPTVRDFNVNSSSTSFLTAAYAQATASQGTFTAETALTGLSVTVVLPASRRIRVSGHVLFSSSVADGAMRCSIFEGATLLNISEQNGSTNAQGIEPSVILTPTEGSHTYFLSGLRSAGTGNLTSNAGPTFPAYILVEDLGATT